ncbi:solute carrier family 35 (UDP-galactose transporter), member B1 [Trypanosoma rangeli]|uniref:Solute carrier family 35 (UDP-galactose transporter), member B1 n=1 Tax=Trypanosoma rangeli TaxID=5698 RepID=A0A422N3L8_TRYRA|nr:solute carrier family 35 (UDP-galactose transporter), member B1 [Trypanosoma rangeli]RNF00065.1 solute carrier family 35 (UDP-galactose transporter), member B1 [Trypanosoma rangeli]|eukprot:RNF00065.1 solute carrier family 35 (UDP-galactose transporter), member B1 [Trypanosoma rangeli]
MHTHATAPCKERAQGSSSRAEKPKKRANTSRTSTAPSRSVMFVVFQMIICVSGIYICFGLWSIKQERVVTKPYRAMVAAEEHAEMARLSTVFVIGFVQAITGTLVGALLLLLEKLYAKFFLPPQATAKVGTATTGPTLKNVTTVSTPRNGAKETPAGAASPPAGAAKAEYVAALRLTSVLGFTNAFGSSMGYAAMRRLPYPVVLATKMSKMVPVMLVGFFWHGTRYSLSKCAACVIITSGVFCFYFLGEKQPPHKERRRDNSAMMSTWVGFLLLFFNLVTDGFTNSTQDVLVKRLQWGGNQLMFFTNLATSTWLLLVLITLEALHPLATVILEAEELTSTMLSDASPMATILSSIDTCVRWYLRDVAPLKDLSRTWHFFQRYPEAFKDVVEMSFLSAIGQFFVFRTISLFGSLTLTALTLLRKSGSVLLSVIIHGHHVAAGQWLSLLVVFAGVVWEACVHVRKAAPSEPGRSACVVNKDDKKVSSSHCGSSVCGTKGVAKAAGSPRSVDGVGCVGMCASARAA